MTRTEEFLRRMRNKLRKKDLSFADLAKETGFSNTMFSLGVRGRTKMKDDNMVIVEMAVRKLTE